jgi:hypothetical protein
VVGRLGKAVEGRARRGAAKAARRSSGRRRLRVHAREEASVVPFYRWLPFSSKQGGGKGGPAAGNAHEETGRWTA